MWTTVYVASGIETAREIEKQLVEEGFMVQVKYFTSENGEELYELLVPRFEAEEIQLCLIELGII
ncbi:MAG TPA: hypothetical protein VK031_06730 [Tissierellaceae bacterium]|nr:hypothetical protein [Tissierellaceae bacterium]